MQIIVDKRTELISIVLALAQGNDYISEHFCFDVKDDYRQKVFEYFATYNNHNCITLAKLLAKNLKGFNYDNPIRLAFVLDTNLNFNNEIDDYLLKELGNEKLIKQFLSELSNFAKTTKFDEFYDSQKDYYASKINQIKVLFGKDQLFTNQLTSFLKRDLKEDFCVNIIPMLLNSNHGFYVGNVVYSNVGLLSDNFKTISPYNDGSKHTIIHEFCHGFVNQNTEKQKINKFFDLKFAPQGYKNPISYLNDTIVRAMTIRLREKLDNIDVQKFFNIEKNMGFVYVKDVYQEILNYEKQNLNWEEYFPTLLSKISKIKNTISCKTAEL